jgi:hypothetical protein
MACHQMEEVGPCLIDQTGMDELTEGRHPRLSYRSIEGRRRQDAGVTAKTLDQQLMQVDDVIQRQETRFGLATVCVGKPDLVHAGGHGVARRR